MTGPVLATLVSSWSLSAVIDRDVAVFHLVRTFYKYNLVLSTRPSSLSVKSFIASLMLCLARSVGSF